MNTNSMIDEKVYRDGDEYIFLPDPKREIQLATTVIQHLMDGASDPESLMDMELKIIRSKAIRILAEVEAIQNKRGEPK